MESNVLHYSSGLGLLVVFDIKSSIFVKCFSEMNKRQAEGNVNSHLYSRERSSNKPLSSCRSGLHKVIEHLICFLSQSLMLQWLCFETGAKVGESVGWLYTYFMQRLFRSSSRRKRAAVGMFAMLYSWVPKWSKKLVHTLLQREPKLNWAPGHCV